MQTNSYTERLKQGLYLFSIFLLLFLSLFIYVGSLNDRTSMSRLPELMKNLPLSLLMLFGSLALTFFLMILHRLFSKLPLKHHRAILFACAVAAICIQLGLLFLLKPVLRYDHLKVFDEALGVLRTGELSLSAHEGYFGHYPFNIPITLLHAGIFRIFTLFGIGEARFMLLLQCLYALAIDSAVAASYLIVKKLRDERTALLFLLICLLHPILYVCAAGCYTTTLMIPLLMWNLFLIIFFLAEKRPRRKLLLGFLLGFFLVFGIKIRATILITVIAFAGYLIVHVRNEHTFITGKKQLLSCTASLLVGGLLCFNGFVLIENAFVKGEYKDTQLPPSYYFMFASNPETLGHYNEDDFEMMKKYPTLDEKNKASIRILKKQLRKLGANGILTLAGQKLKGTWTDGTEDYADFLATDRNYGTLQDYISGNRSDFFALYCHIYHLAMTGMLIVCILFFIKTGCCNTPYYLILLNLLGGMLFHVLWESYYIYSISFLLLMLIAASDGITLLSKQRVLSRHSAVSVAFVVAILPTFLFIIPEIKTLSRDPSGSRQNVIVQDMYDGNDLLPLMKGEAVTQSFCTDKPFSHVAVRVLNKHQKTNTSAYVIQLIDESGAELANRLFSGTDIPNKDYCYLKFPTIRPDGNTDFIIRVFALEADESNYLTFPYYHSGNYDIYSGGKMIGLNSDEKSDLNFLVFDLVP